MCAGVVQLKLRGCLIGDSVGRGSEMLGSYCWLEGRQAWAGKNVDREGVPVTNGSGVKGVVIVDIGSALDLYIFMGVTISCVCTRAQDGRGYFDLEEAMWILWRTVSWVWSLHPSRVCQLSLFSRPVTLVVHLWSPHTKWAVLRWTFSSFCNLLVCGDSWWLHNTLIWVRLEFYKQFLWQKAYREGHSVLLTSTMVLQNVDNVWPLIQNLQRDCQWALL